jgi:hypothetical protein
MHRLRLTIHEATDSLRSARSTIPKLKDLNNVNVVRALVEDIAVAIEGT